MHSPLSDGFRAVRRTQSISLLVLIFIGAIAILQQRTRAETYLVEAEDLELPGGWQITTGDFRTVRRYLLAENHLDHSPAVGAIDVPHSGAWRLWVRSKDFPKDRPGIRHFTVRLGQSTSKTVFGKHGQLESDGWAWEDGGTFELQKGPALIAIGDDATPSARCDALVITDDPNYQPNDVPWRLQKPAATMVPLHFASSSQDKFLPPPVTGIDEKPAAILENGTLRLAFLKGNTSAGPAIVMRGAAHSKGGWIPLKDADAAESYRVLYRPTNRDPNINGTRVYPTWDISLSPDVEVDAGGATVRTRMGVATAPWASGNCFPLRPDGAVQVDTHTVTLHFPPCSVGQLEATWHLPESGGDARVNLVFHPRQPGYVSLGYHAPLAAPVQETGFVLLPFMFHGHRFPTQPVMLLSALTPTPLALVNLSGASCALVAEPADLSFEWPGPKNSRYALGLRNESGLAQPLLYSPVLGETGSRSDGGDVQANFRLCIQSGDWYAAYRHVADEIFGLTDYRRPISASLSDAALNLLDLIKDENASGWNAQAKGPWNIESRNTVTQAAPLTYLSYYLLTGDPDLYQRFALPSLEYVLSRPSPHFAAEKDISDNYYRQQPMRGPASFFGAPLFASAFTMTQGRTPALGSFCIDEKNEPRHSHSNGHMQAFEDSLAVYQLTQDRHWLDLAIAGADKYIAANFTKLPARDLGDQPFVNVSFVPDWEGLLHLYEASGEKRFLDAATEGARWLLTTLWTQPPTPGKEITIHPGGIYDVQRIVWWWGDKRYRRGIFESAATDRPPYAPAPRLPEKQAPAWEVSRTGLGLEQPCTYTRNGPEGNIMMNAWAPNLLRLAHLTHDPSFRTAARNAMIGRFANYPGYYLDGFTTEYQRPDYPITGPDVTSLYVHHIPPTAAYVLDYLFTDAEMRSEGAVTFPSTRQCGYVWFDSRLYGYAPGTIYGQNAWPWLNRTAASVDTINVDRILAHGDGKFHVVLLNQVTEPQPVHVTFDPKVLGKDPEGQSVTVILNNQPIAPLMVKNGRVQLTLPSLGIAALSLSQVAIDVPTHRTAPSAKFALPPSSSIQHAAFPGTALEAIGTEIQVPPFTWRDLYVYVAAGMDDCRAARLRYQAGNGAEKTVTIGRFPWEFSVRIDDTTSHITWTTDVQLPNGEWVSATPH